MPPSKKKQQKRPFSHAEFEREREIASNARSQRDLEENLDRLERSVPHKFSYHMLATYRHLTTREKKMVRSIKKAASSKKKAKKAKSASSVKKTNAKKSAAPASKKK